MQLKVCTDLLALVEMLIQTIVQIRIKVFIRSIINSNI